MMNNNEFHTWMFRVSLMNINEVHMWILNNDELYAWMIIINEVNVCKMHINDVHAWTMVQLSTVVVVVVVVAVGGVRVMVTHDPLSRESKPCVAGCYTEWYFQPLTYQSIALWKRPLSPWWVHGHIVLTADISLVTNTYSSRFELPCRARVP